MCVCEIQRILRQTHTHTHTVRFQSKCSMRTKFSTTLSSLSFFLLLSSSLPFYFQLFFRLFSSFLSFFSPLQSTACVLHFLRNTFYFILILMKQTLYVHVYVCVCEIHSEMICENGYGFLGSSQSLGPFLSL